MFCCSDTNSVCSYCESLNKGYSAAKITLITSCVTCCYAVLEHTRAPIEWIIPIQKFSATSKHVLYHENE